ncbi:MAG: Sel1 domain-containing protein [Hyphomonadaceae bacterium]|nr:MAG: Sel1 domain-containing protein [Hyphomonadaceae bacterium]
MKLSKKRLSKILLFFVAAISLLANIALADGPLPRMPKGPTPKTDLLTQQPLLAPSVGELRNAMRAYRQGNYPRALLISKNLAERGNGDAAALAGFIYEKGLGTAVDYSNAARFYKMGIVQNSTDSMVGLGRMLVDGHLNASLATNAEVKTALERAIALGRKDAESLLGSVLIAHFASPENNQRAFELYKSAAAIDAGAAYQAAIMLDDGEPNPVDDVTLAAPLLKQAAEAGIVPAQSDYGRILFGGHGIEENRSEAAIWFRKAAEAHDIDGSFYWAVVNANGLGVPRNIEIAKTYANFARHQLPDAQRLYEQILAFEAARTAPRN